MRIATWNVNGIRARQGAGRRLDRARAARRGLPAGDQGRRPTRCRRAAASPRLLVLLARRPAATRASRCSSAGTSRRCRRRSPTRRSTSRPASSPAIVGGLSARVGLRAQRRQGLRGEDARSSRALARGPRELQRATAAPARAVRRPQRRARRARRAPEGAQAERDRHSGRTSARCSSGCSARGLVDVGRALDPDNDELFTWWAPWRNLRQRNIGWRLDYVLASDPLAARATRGDVRRRSAPATTRRSSPTFLSRKRRHQRGNHKRSGKRQQEIKRSRDKGNLVTCNNRRHS